MRAFVDSLDIPQEAKEDLKRLTPETYIGMAKELAERV